MAASTDKSARLADLLARTALADQAAFAELYRLTSGQLYGLAVRMLRDHAMAEEIVQDAYVNVWHHAATYAAAKSQPMTWLTSILRNRCLDQLRKRALQTVPITRDEEQEGEVDIDFAADGPGPVDMLVSGAESRSVRACVETLDGGQKQAIALAFYQGLTHAELAQQLRQPLGTIKSWVRRGLERLRQCLDRSGYVH